MTTTKDLRVFIGATDFGPLGADIVQRFSCGRGGPDRIALADLQLIKEGGGGYSILNRQQVKAYEWTSTDHNPSVGYLSAVFFGGFVNLPSTGRAPGSTLKTWKLSAQDYNIQKLRLVVPAAHANGRIEAGTFANQIEQLFVKLQTGASLAFDYVSRVLNLTGATVLPVIYVSGKNLARAMEAIFVSAQAVDPDLRPVFRLRPDPTVGVAITAWQVPVVDVWDSAAPPSSILTLDEDTTTDILARDGYTRVLDSTDQVTKRQSIRKDIGVVRTYTSTAAVATWPNPCDPNGAWWAEPFETEATSTAAQDAELAADVESTANPRETLSLSTQRTPVPEGAEYLDLTLALEGLSAELYGVAGGSTDFVRRQAAPTDSPYLLTTRLDLGLPRVLLGQPGGGSQRRPVTSIPPDVPLNLDSTTSFDPNVGNSAVVYTWDPPANPAGVVGYRLNVTTGGATYTHDIDFSGVYVFNDRMNPGAGYSTTIQSKGLNGLLSVESAPEVGTAAATYVPDAVGSLTLVSRGIGGGGTDRPGPSTAWARFSFVAPGTGNGPHDYYLVRWAASGEPQQSNRLAGTDLGFVISGTPGVTYSVSIQTFSNPAWPGAVAGSSVTMLSYATAGGGAEPASDQALFPYSKSSGTGTPTVDTSDPFEGSSAYKFTSAGADTQVLAGLPFATVEGRTWTVRTAAKKSGGSPTLAGEVQWSTDGAAWGVLSASTLTLPALTTAWPSSYTEQQVTAPSTANFGRLVYTVTFAAALTILAALPQPTPAAGVADVKFLTGSGNPILIYDSSGALRSSVYADGNSPQLTHLHSVTTGGVGSGWNLDSTYGDQLAVGEAAAAGGIALIPAGNKDLALTATGTGNITLDIDTGGYLAIQSVRETRGSSNPGSPGSGDRHYRTDLHRWTYYDGAQWLSEEEVEVGAWTYYIGATVAAEITATQEYMNTETRDDYAYALTRFRIQGYVNGTNNGSNYLDVTLRSFTGLTTLATHSTAGWSGTTWTASNITSFAAQPALGQGLQLYVNRVGAPGGFRFYFKVYARLIIT